MRNMLLLQYLVNVLERDTLPRIHSYKENMNWNLIRESLLNMLLGSRKIIYKSLIKDCLSAMCYMYHEMSQTQNLSMELSANCNTAVVMALPEVKRCACVALKKLLLLCSLTMAYSANQIIELDSARNSADLQGLTSRADGVRTPVSEIILDEITYNSDILSSFFQIFDEPKQKLKLIVQYLQKYIPKSSVRTRRSNGSANNATFDSILKCFSNANSTKSIIKKISGDVAQLLLGHAFQVIVLSSAYLSMCDADFEEGVKRCSLPEVCQNIITAFTCIKREDK
nr:negative regulator of systemic acquired resistance SNI1 isoform X2 [Ipomoea batatas]